MPHEEKTDFFLGPHGHDYGSLAACLQSLGRERVVYVPNPGNAGDALIALGTYKFLEALSIDIEVGDHALNYPNRTIIYGGGGALIKNYPLSADFISRNHSTAKSFIILPSTVRAFPELISEMGDNCKIFAREKITLDYLEAHSSNVEVLLSHDLAFFVDDAFIQELDWDRSFIFSEDRWLTWLKMAIKFYIQGRVLDSTLSSLRIDSEATNISRPEQNHDLSHYFANHDMRAGRMPRNICATTIKMMRMLMMQHARIITNRLHLSILGAITGMQVEMLPNSYDKNVSVFNHSISGFFANVSFVPGEARKRDGGQQKVTSA